MDRRVFIIAGVVLLLGLGFIGYQQLTAPPVYYGVYFDPPTSVPDFTLLSDHGEISLSDFRGQYVMLYFGYTFCPDVCPATLSTLKNAFEKAGSAGEQFQVIFISVDPRRDTPERLGEYSRYFNPSFIGATGSLDDIIRITDEYGIHFHYNDAESQEYYTVDHTSVVLLIDRAGNEQMLWPHEATAKDIASDMKNLVRQ